MKVLMSIKVLNLIINGLPSKHVINPREISVDALTGFKPYYKWITF